MHTETEALAASLRSGVHALGLSLSELQIQRLLDFLALLQKWNKVYNLTAVREPHDMLTHHLLDSLAAVSPLRRHVAELLGRGVGQGGLRLLDVGSGGGLPGVVFAICCPEVDVSCVDTVGKKAAFIQQAAVTLALPNLRGVHARVESLTQPFDVVSCRAFASLSDFVTWSRGAVAAPHGVWLAMKGKHPAEEMAALDAAQVQVFHVEPLQVPGLDAERCIVWIRPAAAG
ncbi:16S rRNA (guanine(527)-N(7))-methyltransferase RsmG [Acidovorax lacteus]|uniref:Ribosomal RNA small subunit methyltransferase G n=1 Tax=Acidovorax lacteus TaxID=1924988 RepID=A0ABP8LII9_9BURK